MKAWPGVRLASDLGAERLGLDRLDEALDHRQRDVRLEQRHAHLAQRLADVLLGDAAAAAQALDGAGQALRSGCRTWGFQALAGAPAGDSIIGARSPFRFGRKLYARAGVPPRLRAHRSAGGAA